MGTSFQVGVCIFVCYYRNMSSWNLQDQPRGGQVPAYIQVASTLRGRILRQEYPSGTFIAPARELEAEFGVSSITIRKALEVLAHQGYLIPRQGVGTQVAEGPKPLVEIEIAGNFREWFESASGRHPGLEIEVMEIGPTRCPRRIARILCLEPGAEVWRMLRVRKHLGEPVSYFINYAPWGTVGRIDPEVFRERSFLQVYQQTCGVKLARMEQRVRACVADIDLARILGVDFGVPLFFVENVYFSVENQAMEVTQMYYRGDRYVYKATFDLPETDQYAEGVGPCP